MTRKMEPYNSGDKKDVSKAKRVSRILDNRMKNGILKIAADPEIRYVISNFLDTAMVFRPTFSQVPTQHAYNDGFRNAGLWWMTNLLLHVPEIIAMLQADDGSPLVSKDDGHNYTDASSTGSDDADGDDD